jgi:hypothetical protein
VSTEARAATDADVKHLALPMRSPATADAMGVPAPAAELEVAVPSDARPASESAEPRGRESSSFAAPRVDAPQRADSPVRLTERPTWQPFAVEGEQSSGFAVPGAEARPDDTGYDFVASVQIRDAQPPEAALTPAATLPAAEAIADARGSVEPLVDLRLPGDEVAPDNPYLLRDAENRMNVVERMGGSEATERAVAMALAWLARHQSEVGRWDGSTFDEGCGVCGGETEVTADAALTGLAALCFLGAGHTHMIDGPYQGTVRRALRWLVEHQDESGDLRNGETMYSQGIAAIALSEAYAMSKDAALRAPVDRAMRFIVNARHSRAGGWRYDSGQLGDTSVLGWQLMALKSARMSGVYVPADAFDTGRIWLDTVSRRAPGHYAYTPDRPPTPSMTAEGMFVQQLLGMDRDHPRMKESADFILQHLPNWESDPNTYFWYYASLALFQHQGREWTVWNEALTGELLAKQRQDGKPAGSWDPADRWSTLGGRIYQTALCTLMLEVYYRYLPLYTLDGQPVAETPPAGPGTVHGRVIDAATGEPLAGAAVRLDRSGRDPVVAAADERGAYRLEAFGVPDHFALSASVAGYLPHTLNIEAEALERGPLTVDFPLQRIRGDVVAIEAAPEVHHLGDDRFEGQINSQFQKDSEGAEFEAEFELAAEQLARSISHGEVLLLAKGVQRSHRLYVNGAELDDRLDDAPSDGSFGEFRARFDKSLLRPGTNRFRIVAAPSSSDIDDFEFVNVQIRLVP